MDLLLFSARGKDYNKYPFRDIILSACKMSVDAACAEKGEKIQGEMKPVRKQARDKNGRFVKGSTPPKSPGRPKKPKELEKLMPKSLKTIEAILNSAKTGDRLKFETAKWVIEMNIGKPSQQVDATVDAETKLSAIVLEFEGELEEWSE